jgi:hypothetical protein
MRAGGSAADDPRMRLVLLALAALLLLAAPAAAAPKPSKIHLFHVTHLEATSEVTAADGVVASTKVSADFPNRKWQGRANAGFWGSEPGWGSLSTPVFEEPWTVTRPWREEKYVQDEEKHEMYIETTMCTTIRKRSIGGSFKRGKNGRDFVRLALPGPPNELPCATEVDWPGFDSMEDVRVPITRTQMTRRRTKISFDASETRSGTTVRWKGTI